MGQERVDKVMGNKVFGCGFPVVRQLVLEKMIQTGKIRGTLHLARTRRRRFLFTVRQTMFVGLFRSTDRYVLCLERINRKISLDLFSFHTRNVFNVTACVYIYKHTINVKK